jgi:membrane protein implicated in regulation of membrane protease activity
MKKEILEELAKGHLGSGLLLRLVFIRGGKVVILYSILALLCYLLLLENYAWLFLLLGTVSGFVIFLTWRFFEKRFEENHREKVYIETLEDRKLAEPKETKRISAVED